MKITTKDIAFTAIIAALYAVLTLVTYPISFLGIQFRLSEILIILTFFNRSYSVGLVAIGEFAVLLVGYIVYLIVRKKPEFYKLIQANRNLEFKF